jgi:hypothetical protein
MGSRVPLVDSNEAGRELSLSGEVPPTQTGSAAAGPGSPPGWSGWR